MLKLAIDTFTHFFKVCDPDPNLQQALSDFVRAHFLETTLEYKDGKWYRIPGRVFATRTRDKEEYRFHLNSLDTFTAFMAGRGYEVFIEHDERPNVYPGDDATFHKPKGFALRDYQVPIASYILEPGYTKIVELHPGAGKTSLSLWAASEYGKKLCIFVLGRYTERWWGDVGLWMDADKILEIRGSLELEDVLRQSDTPFVREKEMFVMTITTFSDYCTKWEIADKAMRKTMVPPELVWEALGVGMRITDETHQHFQQNFIADLYTHLSKTVYLSATLNPGDGFIRKMYETMLPVKNRAGGGLQKKYTHVYAMFYRFRLPHQIRCNNRKRMYNHTEFEKWLMRNPKILENYFAMIDEIIEERFIAVRKQGQKQLVFFATKKMCGLYVKRLKKRYPSLDCRRYISEDKYENLLKADIACSTLGSSGTAVDIPNLLRCLMTVALKSEQANLQALGRLRYLEDQVEFDYLVCTDIPKHVGYHYKKKKLFKDWVKLHDEIYTEKTL